MSQNNYSKKEDQQAFQHLQAQQFQIDNLNNDQCSVQNQLQLDDIQGNYELRLLHSKINELEIERQKIIIYYENQLEGEKQRISALQQENYAIIQQNKNIYEKLQQITQQANQIAEQNQQLRQELQRNMSKNDKSSELSDYKTKSESIMDINNKEQMRKKQQQYINTIKTALDNETEEFDQYSGIQAKYAQLQEKYMTELEQLKQNQVNIKRTYENMLQSKENIIRKLTNLTSEGSKRELAQKNQIISGLQKQLSEYFHLLQQQKAFSENLQKKLHLQDDEKMVSLYESLKQKSNIVPSSKLKKQNIHKDEQEQDSNCKESLVISEMQNYISTIKPEIFVLNQNRIIMEQAIKDLQQHKSSLATQLQQQIKQNTALKQEYNAEVARLRLNCQTLEKKLEQSAQMYQRSLQQKQKQIEKLTNELKSLEMYKSKFSIKQAKESVDMSHMLEQISLIQERVKQSQAYNNLQKENQKLKFENESIRRSLDSLNQKYKEKNEKIYQNEQKIRNEYNERIKSLQAELIKLTKSQQNSAVDNLNSGIKKVSDTKEQLQRLKLVNEILEMEKIQKDQQIKKLTKELQETTNKLKIVQDNLKKTEKQCRDKKQDYRQLEILYEDLEEKFKNGVKDLQAQIQDMNQSLLNEKKKNDLKKQQSKKNQQKLLSQVKKLRNIINELEQELQDAKENKGKEMNQMEEKIQKLAHQILVINKQRQAMMKANQLDMKNKCKGFEEERQKINEYVLQLEEKCELLFDKTEHLEYNNEELTQSLNEMQQYEETFKNMERDNYELKVQLSQALNEVNQTLQRYKQLQEKYQDTVSQQQLIRQKYNNLHQKYCDLCQEKSKNIVQLDNCYDQIEKLNKVLMSKEKQLVRNKAESRWYANSPSQSNNIPMSPRQIPHSPKMMTVPVNENRMSKLELDSSPSFFTPHNPRTIVSPQQLKINKYLKPENYTTGVNITAPSKHTYKYY